MNNLTLTIDLSVWKTNSSDVPRLSIRSVEQKDTEEVGRLYFASYPAGLVGANVDDAIQELSKRSLAHMATSGRKRLQLRW